MFNLCSTHAKIWIPFGFFCLPELIQKHRLSPKSHVAFREMRRETCMETQVDTQADTKRYTDEFLIGGVMQAIKLYIYI